MDLKIKIKISDMETEKQTSKHHSNLAAFLPTEIKYKN